MAIRCFAEAYVSGALLPPLSGGRCGAKLQVWTEPWVNQQGHSDPARGETLPELLCWSLVRICSSRVELPGSVHECCNKQGTGSLTDEECWMAAVLE